MLHKFNTDIIFPGANMPFLCSPEASTVHPGSQARNLGGFLPSSLLPSQPISQQVLLILPPELLLNPSLLFALLTTVLVHLCLDFCRGLLTGLPASAPGPSSPLPPDVRVSLQTPNLLKTLKCPPVPL